MDRKEVNANPTAEKSFCRACIGYNVRTALQEDAPREWKDVADEARLTHKEVYDGVIFGFVVEKNTELLIGVQRRLRQLEADLAAAQRE